MSKTVLSGLKVVEIGTHVAVPYFARVLADWGAEVVKIEPPQGEAYRHIGEMFRLPTQERNNPIFVPYNLNKKSLCLDLKKSEGQEVVHRLLSEADVLAMNARPQALDRLGLNLESLRARYPRLIVAHLNGFGPRGDEKDRPGFDSAAFWCRSGVIGEWMNAGDRPFKPFYGFGDAVASSQLLAGVLAALYTRERTGLGDTVHVSLFHAGLWTNVAGILRGNPQFGKEFPQPRTNPITPMDTFYRTKDGKWVLIAETAYDRKSGAYFDLIGRPELKDDPDYCTWAGAFERLAEMVAIFDEGFAKVTSDEVAAMLDRIDTVYEFARVPSDVVTDRQAWANDFLTEVQTPDGEPFVIPTNPVVFDSQGAADYGPAPLLGENSQEVLRSLGYSEADIRELLDGGSVVGRREESLAKQ